MPSITSIYPLDLTGTNPSNLVAGEKRLLLSRGNTPYRVVSFTQGGFYTPSLKVYDKNFKPLVANKDYVATYKHVDASSYTGIEICSAVVLLNAALTDYVLLDGQMVGSDFAFSQTVEDDTIAYLEGLANGALPTWAGYIGDEPQWQAGELQEDHWEKHHYGYLNASIEQLTMAITAGNGDIEDQVRKAIKDRFNDFISRFQGQVLLHINDHNNPHNLSKDDIGLDQVVNYPVATEAIARAGSSLTHYLTVKGIYAMLDQFGSINLDDHIKVLHTAHNPTAESLGLYTKQQIDSALDKKLPLDGTAADAGGMLGGTVSQPTPARSLSAAEMYSEIRSNLPTSAFTTGRIAPERMGRGTPTKTSVLLATGEWIEFADLYKKYSLGMGNDIYWAGEFANATAGLAAIKSTYTNLEAYPTGTVVIFQITAVETRVYSNGVWTDNSYTPFRAAIRSASGWFVLT